MAFKLVYHSQQDPQWKSDTLGFGDSGDTIGYVGCALTSVAMLLSGHGFEETPKSLNQKLKARQGFVSAGIRWDVVSQVQPRVSLKGNIRCETSDAPLGQINAALDKGQPVIVRVDASPNPGLQWHYVLLYARKGDDYLMLDPWPYQPGTAKEDLLMKRYSQGRSLKNAIQQVLFYEAAGAGGPVVTPTEDTEPVSPIPEDAVFARVMDSVTLGLNIRLSTDTSSMANVVATAPAGSRLMLLQKDDAWKIGRSGQWVRVREPGGREGFAAAWFLEPAGEMRPGPEPEPVDETPGGGTTGSRPGRSRPSVSDGLDHVSLGARTGEQIADNTLLARIWNKYGGLLSAIAERMGFDPAIAVAILAQESGGQPYGGDGRLIIRFENHLFYEYWGRSNSSVYNRHFRSGTPIWTGHQWRPKASAAWRDCHTSQGVEWEVFSFASQLDDPAAKKSISMGLPQVLGSNYGILGFASVQDMFNAFVASEREQVAAFFDFLQGNGPRATNALKERDFRTVASIYNGAGNAEYYGRLIGNLYDTFIALRGNRSPVPGPTPDPVPGGETPAPTPETPAPTPSTPAEPPGRKRLTVLVSEAVGTSGLRLRKSPSKGGALVTVLRAGAELTVLEDSKKAKAKLGRVNKWIYVREAGGKRGYVGAEYVRLP